MDRPEGAFVVGDRVVDEVEDGVRAPRQGHDVRAVDRPGGLLRADAHCRVPGWDRVVVVGDSGSFPGPDWMPKQAHMADLQAEAAVENLLAELAGGKPEKTFKVELLCIVDSLDSGMLVKRTPEGGFALPPLGLMHNAKAFFESWYLRRYR